MLAYVKAVIGKANERAYHFSEKERESAGLNANGAPAGHVLGTDTEHELFLARLSRIATPQIFAKRLFYPSPCPPWSAIAAALPGLKR